jgi:transposase-like protein
MTRPFSIALKRKMVARLTGANAASAAQLARETGISQQNLSRWLSEARTNPLWATDESVGIAKRISKLERELAHKERALAEAATLLVLREKPPSVDESEPAAPA